MKKEKKIRIIIISISIIAVIIGLVRINIINTEALSPLGNSKENYEKIKDSFGDDFADFINDNSEVKIYKEEDDDILIRIGKENYKIRKQSYLIELFYEAEEYVEDVFNNTFSTLLK